MNDYEITSSIIGISIEVHKALGPGLLEHVYKECLFHKISQHGIYAVKEYPVPLVYEEIKLECGFRIDILVMNRLVLEIKSVEALHDVHLARTLTYMKLGNFRLGLLMNFNVLFLKDGIKRLINT